MDWTGGTKRRFANRKGNSTLQKQRAHFAKARAANSKHPPTKSASLRSFRPDYNAVPHVAGDAYPSSQHSSQSRSSHRSRSEQSISRSGSVVSRAQSKNPKKRHHPESAHRASDEHASNDNALEACRRRLKAQNDWLGLSAARPIQMAFPAREDKAAIGKRRKIERTHSVRARQPIAVQEPPLFAERPLFEEHLMSGALPPPENDEIRIKIGTDAFASQTLPSRTSRTPATTHIHNLSSRYPHHSEEEVVELSSDVKQDWNRAFDQPDWLEICGEPEFVNGVQMDHRLEGTLHDKHALRSRYEPHSTTSIADIGRSDDLVSLPSPPVGPTAALPHDWSPRRPVPELPRDHYETPTRNLDLHVATAPSLARPSPVVDSVEIDEQNWRQFLDLTPDPCGDASIAVVRSSSQHVTPSTRFSPDAHPIIEQLHGQQPRTSPGTLAISKDCIPADKGSSPSHTIRPTSNNDNHSPSASLQQIQKLINLLPSRKDPHQDEMVEDEQMWRRFVIGIRSSDSSSTTHPNPRIVCETDDSEMEPMFNSDHDSDKATIATSRVAPVHNRAHPSNTFNDPESISPAKQSLSVVAQASTARLEVSDDGSQSLRTLAAMPPQPNQEVSVDPRRRFKKPLVATAVTTAKRYNTRSRRVSEQSA